jgi:hypothetical protein
MDKGVNVFRPNDDGDDRIKAGERFTGAPGSTDTLWFGVEQDPKGGSTVRGLRRRSTEQARVLVKDFGRNSIS